MYFIDHGSTHRVPLSAVCLATPPQMCHSPQQALHCSLHAVSLSEELASADEVLSHFVSITKSTHGLRAVVHCTSEDPCDIALYTL